jgi:hypothetical protein
MSKIDKINEIKSRLIQLEKEKEELSQYLAELESENTESAGTVIGTSILEKSVVSSDDKIS